MNYSITLFKNTNLNEPLWSVSQNGQDEDEFIDRINTMIFNFEEYMGHAEVHISYDGSSVVLDFDKNFCDELEQFIISCREQSQEI